MSDREAYEIRGILDFLRVPKERRAACLHEFGIFLDMVEPSCSLLGSVADEAIGPGAVSFAPIDRFVWTDDGEIAATLSVMMSDGSSQEVFTLTPDDARAIVQSVDSILGAAPDAPRAGGEP